VCFATEPKHRKCYGNSWWNISHTRWALNGGAYHQQVSGVVLQWPLQRATHTGG
jgi:hypothetical protein